MSEERAGGQWDLGEEVQIVFLVVDGGGEDLVVLYDPGPEGFEALPRVGTNEPSVSSVGAFGLSRACRWLESCSVCARS